jgi:serine/threonine-protein kinase
VIGAPEQQAKDTLTRAGLRVGEIRQQASDERLGVVIEQDPGPEEQVAADTAVALTVSTGPDSVPVPAVVGQSLAAARTALSDAGLAVGSVAYGDSPEPAGEVLTVTPTAGTPVVRGSGVTLRVASGRNLVPDVRGRSSAEARAALEEAGFRVAVERQPVSDPPPDRVISTVPRQGASARVGSTVTIAVSQAPAPTPTPEPPPPSVPESPPPEEPPTPAVSPSPTA